MSFPDHLRRYPAQKAIDSLAARFGLPNTPFMHDWEWEVADSDRIDEFVAGYHSGELNEDERFTLMETIIQSFEDLPNHPDSDPRWEVVVGLLSRYIDIHLSTVWYWSALETEDLEDAWRVTPSLRKLLYTQPQYWAEQGVDLNI